MRPPAPRLPGPDLDMILRIILKDPSRPPFRPSRRMNRVVLPVLLLVAACAPLTSPPPQPSPTPEPAKVGVLVMAHGGGPEWDDAVEAAVASSGHDSPTAVAFGMADRSSLQVSLDSLARAGVTRVALVRLFLSGEAFAAQTRYYVGFSDEPPQPFILMGPASSDPRAREPLSHSLDVATHDDGLLGSVEVERIVQDRATALSSEPSRESVLVLAHGMGDDASDARLQKTMERLKGPLLEHGFANVMTATLREDWPDERRAATAAIRDYVAMERASGRRVLVVPLRLFGFGPYADVLEGLTYLPGESLLPHPAVGQWIRHKVDEISCTRGWADCS